MNPFDSGSPFAGEKLSSCRGKSSDDLSRMIILFVIIILMEYFLLAPKFIDSWNLSHRGIEVTATVTDKKLYQNSKHDRHVTEYTFELSGNRYASSSELSFELWKTRTPGKKVTVIVDPLNPELSEMTLAFGRNGWISSFLGMLLPLIVFTVLLIAVLKERR
ncbi:MAG: hypothetical protein CVV64_19115 [Candidatus Wallbacteria bacterium HGW-Wallbacteria-1]|jgi:hypothetical protein|uniref:DUF3592 domain-containing protein n=1 Tax=Candidatus Wallbacteria bacterium HGW-Wallbacteria-1 TaxID=2013854 RepID=A0A2N1PJ19_9BACT|nr:MAG: hypothetical protein CVV64_19115 [Candidatus Wallbacteria bacterium HGW-Wallbacteria-1]